MADPTATAAAGGAVAGAAVGATLAQSFGLDPVALLWGLVGGGIWVTAQSGISAVRAIVSVLSSSALAGGVGPLAALWAHQYLTGIPEPPIKAACAVVLGAGAQKLMPALIDALANVAGRWFGGKGNTTFGGNGGT